MDIIDYTIDHYDAVMDLMRCTPGISIRSADSKEHTARYLERNPGLNFIAIDNGQVIACAMCGHDGRRGYLQHVVVAELYRGKGIADSLVERCLDGLKAIGITKAHLDVFATNERANTYWQRRGWKLRDDINRYSLIMGDDDNA